MEGYQNQSRKFARRRRPSLGFLEALKRNLIGVIGRACHSASYLFDDESPHVVTITSSSPPELLRWLVTGLSECAHDALDRCDRLLTRLVGVRDDFTFDHFVVRIKVDLYDLKSHLINLRRATRRVGHSKRTLHSTKHITGKEDQIAQ